MFGEGEALCDFAIGETFSDTPNNIDFTCREHRTVNAGEVGERWLGQRFKNEVQFAAVGPHLSDVHALNALGQQMEGFGPAKNALGSGAKSFGHGRTL